MKVSEIKEKFTSLVPAVVLVSRWQLEGKASSIRKTQTVSDQHIQYLVHFLIGFIYVHFVGCLHEFSNFICKEHFLYYFRKQAKMTKHKTDGHVYTFVTNEQISIFLHSKQG